MCDRCVQNFEALPEDMKEELASRCRALGSAMCQGAIDSRYDGIELLAALEASAAYLRMQMDAGVQELAKRLVARIMPKILEQAKAHGVVIAPPADHPPATFGPAIEIVFVEKEPETQRVAVSVPAERPTREPAQGSAHRLPPIRYKH